MKYKELIKLFEEYAEEEVSMIASRQDVVFFPVSDGDIEIVHLRHKIKEPCRAYRVEG